MNEFQYQRPADAPSAVRMFAEAATAAPVRYLGGGTNLVDLMRRDVERPATVIDVSGLLSRDVRALPDGGVWIGAGARNTEVAAHRAVRERFPAVAAALLAGASGQIRNMATIGGNLLQRTRCAYFYDVASRCNKRSRGAGCDALEGFNRMHAILGASEHCIATHPSDLAVALVALDAVVHVQGAGGTRTLPLRELHRVPGDTPDVETTLAPGELITAVEVPPLPWAARSTYRKVRDRASYAFALVSVAGALDVHEGRVREARLAFGGVAHRPWRALAAERTLKGAPAEAASFRDAADIELANAVGRRDNAFKVDLARRLMVLVLQELATKGDAR